MKDLLGKWNPITFLNQGIFSTNLLDTLVFNFAVLLFGHYITFGLWWKFFTRVEETAIVNLIVYINISILQNFCCKIKY